MELPTRAIRLTTARTKGAGKYGTVSHNLPWMMSLELLMKLTRSMLPKVTMANSTRIASAMI